LGRALALSSKLHDTAGEATALNGLGNVAEQEGELDSALTLYGHALMLRRAARDRAGEAATLYNTGNVHLDRRRPDSALVYYRQSLDMERSIGNRRGEGRILTTIGRIYAGGGELDSAGACFRSAADLARAGGHRRDELDARVGLGLMHYQRREADSALSSWQRALAIARELTDRRLEGAALGNIGSVYFTLLHQQDSALRYYRDALAIQRAVGDDRGAGLTLNNLGRLYHADQADSALGYYREALRAERAAGDWEMESQTLINLTMLFHARGQFDSAIASVQTLLPIHRALHDRLDEARDLSTLASLYQELGQPDTARTYAQQAHELAAVDSAGAVPHAAAQDTTVAAKVEREVFADHPAISVVNAIVRAKRAGQDGVLIVGSGPDVSTSCFVPDDGTVSCAPLKLASVVAAQLLGSPDAADAPLLIQGLWGEPAVALIDRNGDHVAWRYDAKFAAMGRAALVAHDGMEVVLAERNKGLLFFDAMKGKLRRTVQMPPVGDLFTISGSDGHGYLMGLGAPGFVVVLTTAGEFVRGSRYLGVFHAATNRGTKPVLFVAPKDTLYTLDEQLQTAGGWYAPQSADLHIEAVDRSEGPNGVLVALFIGAGRTRARTGLYLFGPDRRLLLAETSLSPNSGLLLVSSSEHSVAFLVGDLGRTWRYTVTW
jgi:tetratricopeptide (TPR) repeat protein